MSVCCIAVFDVEITARFLYNAIMESLEILYYDKYILSCLKPAGINSEDELILALKQQLGGEYYSIHRLDKPVSGVIVLAKTSQAAAKMTAEFSGRKTVKQYLSVVEGSFEEESGTLNDLLFYDRAKAKSFIVKRERKGVKEASLDYTVLRTAVSEGKALSLVLITLHTGRTHQIRVQFGSRKHAVAGDARYGSTVKLPQISLLSYKLEFIHPFTGDQISLISPVPDAYPWNIFDPII